jgi:hypothetical protein
MFNSGRRGKRAGDGSGILSVGQHFNQQEFPIPTITGYSVTGDSDYEADDTALDTAGGQTITLNGSGFKSGATVTLGGASIGSVSVTSTTISFTAPAKTAGTYNVYVTNPGGGTAVLAPGVLYSGDPTWVSPAAGAELGPYYETSSYLDSFVATNPQDSNSAIVYSLYDGAFPSGAVLDSNAGTLSGTAPVDAGSTTYSFTIKATDSDKQDTLRSFTLTVNADVVTWSTPDTTQTVQVDAAISPITLSASSAVGYSVSYSADSLPTGLSLSNDSISGTPTVTGSQYTTLTATSATTSRTATRTITWTIELGGDANINDVLVLMQTDKTSYITDLGSDPWPFTEQGDTKPASFSPYRGSYYSNYYSATSAYLTYSPAGSDSFGTGDFTVECWYYPNEVTASDILMPSATANTWSLLTYNNQLYWKENGSNLGGTGYGTVVKSAWNHLVVSRSGTTLKMFINGEQVYSATNSYDYSGAPSTRSVGPNGGGSAPYYLSNVRIVKGSALYTAAFTPPTSPLTTTSQGATASEVELLTCQSNRFIDNSSNDFTLTIAGAPAVSGHVPFAADTTYATYGSAYFDGSGDYLTNTSSTAMTVGTGDFTAEYWFYQTGAMGGFQAHFGNSNSNNSLAFGTGGTNLYVTRTSAGAQTGGTAIKTGQWYHVAWVRSSGTLKNYLNGVEEYSASWTTDWTVTGVGIGGNPSGNYIWAGGYIADVRFTESAVYTAAFTPPTEPLSAVSGTTLLSLQYNYPIDNYAVVDKSGSEMPLTVYGDINTASFSPYSPYGYSTYHDGTGDYLLASASNEFVFGSEDFTIEAWIHPTTSGAEEGIVNNWQGGGAFIFRLTSANKLNILYYTGSTIQKTSTDTVSKNEWTHVAVVRYSDNIYFYINGVADSGGAQSETGTIAYLNGAAKDLKIGTSGDSGNVFNGYISNLRIVKGTAIYTSAFTPSTAPLTPTEKTSLLACQSPSFIDNSPHKHTLSRYGDVRSTAFSPFAGHTITPDTHSNYFDGTGDYLMLAANSDFVLSGDFTIEAWVWTTTTTGDHGIISMTWSSSSGSNGLALYLGGSNIDFWVAGNGSNVQGSTTITTNEWHHVALVRNGSTNTLYIDGTSESTSNTTPNFPSTPLIGIGRYYNDNSSYLWDGYISNVRIVDGTALYTGNFTPSTSPLTTTSQSATASEVLLLTCQDNKFIDNSSNGYDITPTGDVVPSEYNPFGYTTTSKVAYSPITHGGSMYGDGATDYVDVPANSWNSVGSGDFCIQFWTYSKEVDANKGQIAVGGNKISIRFDSSNRMTFWVAGNGGPTSTPNNTVYPFNWYHVCLERSGSTNTLYINGVAQATNTTTPSNDASPIIRIGGQYADNTGYTFTGWISDVRIQSKAVYKGNFVPPKQIEYGDQTKLQVPFSDAAIYDAKSNSMFDVNALYLATDIGKFNNQSLKFSGINDYVDTTERHGTTKVYGEQLKIGTGDYTIEFWWNFASTSGRQDLLWIGSTSTRLGILWNLNAGKLTYYPATDAISATVSFSTDTWYHIAVSRSSGTTKMFVDGTQVGSSYADTKDFNGDILYLGKDSGGSSSYSNGYMDNLRITKGTARYTSNFTAPTASFRSD